MQLLWTALGQISGEVSIGISYELGVGCRETGCTVCMDLALE